MLESSIAEKDLGVLVDMDQGQQCVIVTMKANSVMGCIRRCCQPCKGSDLSPFLNAGKMHAEYSVQFWDLQ